MGFSLTSTIKDWFGTNGADEIMPSRSVDTKVEDLYSAVRDDLFFLDLPDFETPRKQNIGGMRYGFGIQLNRAQADLDLNDALSVFSDYGKHGRRDETPEQDMFLREVGSTVSKYYDPGEFGESKRFDDDVWFKQFESASVVGEVIEKNSFWSGIRGISSKIKKSIGSVLDGVIGKEVMA